MRHADYGPLKNNRKSRHIEKYRYIYEFKTMQGDRLLYFYLPNRRTVLTHGFHKGVPAQKEYKKAESMMKQYLREVENE
jgi:hypothetical protein